VGLKSTIVGHVGDGNFHALILFKDDRELEIVKEAVHRLVHRAIALDGTCRPIPFGLRRMTVIFLTPP
jgi:D-lactate dehydrogenase (cytochrome)